MYKRYIGAMTRMKFNFLNDHALEILSTALPHVNPQAQNSMNLILKASDLMTSVNDLNQPGDLSACEINEEVQNPEVLLTNLRPVCNRQEGEFVDMILNFFKARKLFSAYENYNSSVLQANELGQKNKNSFGFNSNVNIMDFLLSQLTPDQRSTFEMMQTLMNSMPKETETASASTPASSSPSE